MELKKNKRVDLGEWKVNFFQLGLIFVLVMVAWSYDYQTQYDEEVISDKKENNFKDEEELPPDMREEEPPPEEEQEPEPEPIIDPEEIEVKENTDTLSVELEITDVETEIVIEEEEEEESEEIFRSAAVWPTLCNCDNISNLDDQLKCTEKQIMQTISRNFKYPEIAKANSIEGRVFIQFVVEKTGKLSNIEILKGIDKHIDAAALQAVRSLNNVCGKGFSPARNAIGRPIRLAYTVPINCVLQ